MWGKILVDKINNNGKKHQNLEFGATLYEREREGERGVGA